MSQCFGERKKTGLYESVVLALFGGGIRGTKRGITDLDQELIDVSSIAPNQGPLLCFESLRLLTGWPILYQTNLCSTKIREISIGAECLRL
jgi:hypothetical protein